ncbi:MAG TPA: hypothetical protein VG674_30245 [Amycolatopsis sp.]|nr:hypothetical protein [Amycolatopsis sp.]
MPKRSRSRRDPRSCLTGGQDGNVAFGVAVTYPPRQPTGPTRPGGNYRSSVFRWPLRPREHPPEPDDEV